MGAARRRMPYMEFFVADRVSVVARDVGAVVVETSRTGRSLEWPPVLRVEWIACVDLVVGDRAWGWSRVDLVVGDRAWGWSRAAVDRVDLVIHEREGDGVARAVAGRVLGGGAGVPLWMGW